MNEYVVIVQMRLTGPTRIEFTSLHKARDFAVKRSSAWPAVVWTDVQQSFDGMATGPEISFGRYSRGSESRRAG